MNRKKNMPSKNATDNTFKWATLVLAGLSLVFSFTAIRKVNRMKDAVCVVVECPQPTSAAPDAPIVDGVPTMLVAP
jgi:hypothetical protein